MNLAINSAIVTRLGTATLAGSAVFFNSAPDNQPYPYIIFDYPYEADENMTPTRVVNTLVFIRGYASTVGQAGTIDGQINTLFHMKPLTITGYTNYDVRRENAYSLEEINKAGTKVQMAGAEYRLYSQKP